MGQTNRAHPPAHLSAPRPTGADPAGTATGAAPRDGFARPVPTGLEPQPAPWADATTPPRPSPQHPPPPPPGPPPRPPPRGSSAHVLSPPAPPGHLQLAHAGGAAERVGGPRGRPPKTRPPRSPAFRPFPASNVRSLM